MNCKGLRSGYEVEHKTNLDGECLAYSSYKTVLFMVACMRYALSVDHMTVPCESRFDWIVCAKDC